jgi:hypothetical protein
MGKDGKPELGPDGKPKMGDPQPLAIPQGVGRVIPGFDYGLVGMKIGGKRRIFIPWQLAYGTRAMPDRPDHPGIPAKSDLIFDVELVEVTDIPAFRLPRLPFILGPAPTANPMLRQARLLSRQPIRNLLRRRQVSLRHPRNRRRSPSSNLVSKIDQAAPAGNSGVAAALTESDTDRKQHANQARCWLSRCTEPGKYSLGRLRFLRTCT